MPPGVTPSPLAIGADPTAAGWTAAEIRRVGHRVVDLIADYLTGLPTRPVFRPMPAAEARALAGAPLPARGASADEILEDFAARVAPYPFGNGHPRFYGWVNSPPAVMGVFAEALAAAMNPSVAGGNHAAVHLEHQVVAWFRELFGFPERAGGHLVSGGSAAALTALAAARHAAARRAGWDVRESGLQGAPARLVVYRSGEGHGCHQKAIEMLGLGSESQRTIPADGSLRLSPGALDAAIRADLARGHVPMAVIASAGTVNTGTIDPLDDVADVCAEHGVWLHVDGAYGAPAILTTAYRDALTPIARADSLAVDPHKWLYVPVEAGLVLVRRAQDLREAFSLVPPYLRTDGDEQGVQGPPWFSEFGMQQTRGFRALKVWMTLRHFGLEGYRSALEHDCALAARLAAHLDAAPDFECRQPQSLSIVCFRHLPEPRSADARIVDAHNERVLRAVQLGGEAFLSGTTIDGRFWLRACIVNPLASEKDMELLLDVVRREAHRLAAHAAGDHV